MGKKYKVIALSVGGLKNKIFKSGEIVDETAFGKENIDQLVKGGFIESEKVEKLNVKDLVEKINEAKTIEQVLEICENDDRSGVKKAKEDKVEEILMDAIEATQNISQLEVLNTELMNDDVKSAFDAKKEELEASEETKE